MLAEEDVNRNSGMILPLRSKLLVELRYLAVSAHPLLDTKKVISDSLATQTRSVGVLNLS